MVCAARSSLNEPEPRSASSATLRLDLLVEGVRGSGNQFVCDPHVVKPLQSDASPSQQRKQPLHRDMSLSNSKAELIFGIRIRISERQGFDVSPRERCAGVSMGMCAKYEHEG